MSECVVRMEMPINCLECPMYDYNRHKLCCNAHFDLRPIPNGGVPKPDWCPILCQLPEGHGRLGDLNALTRLMLERKQPLVGSDSSKDRYRYMQWLADFNAIRDAKTIIPVEAEREVDASDAVAPTDTPTDTPTVPAERSET